MDKLNSCHGFVPEPDFFNGIQENAEKAIKTVIKNTIGKGIVEGCEVTLSDTEFIVSPGYAFDGNGQIIVVTEPLSYDLSTVQRPPEGLYIVGTFFLKAAQKRSTIIYDDWNQEHHYNINDAAQIELITSEPLADVDSTTPFETSLDDKIILLDFAIDHASPFSSALATEERREIKVLNEVLKELDAKISDNKELILYEQSRLTSSLHRISKLERLDNFEVGQLLQLNIREDQWVDNFTYPGWYACVAENEGHGCPNLEGRFLISKKSDLQAFGGAASVAVPLPRHNHEVALSKNLTGSYNFNKSFSYVNRYWDDITLVMNSTSSSDAGTYLRMTQAPTGAGTIGTYKGGKTDHLRFMGSRNATTPTISITDSIVMNIPCDLSGNSAYTGEVNPRIDITPPYYSVLTVMKCYKL